MQRMPIALRFVVFSLLFGLGLVPRSFAIGNHIAAVDVDGTTGQYTSMVLDAQGYPTISYYDASEQKLKVAHCFTRTCSRFNSIVTPDAAASIGQYTAVALDSTGKPVVSYYDEANSALKVLHCGNSSCSAGNTIATPDNTGSVGLYTSVTLDGNDFPVVSYYDAGNGKLKILHCGNAACTAGNTMATPDMTGSNGVQSSIQLNNAGHPVVAYFDFTNSSLKIITCGNSACNAGNTTVTVDSVADVGRYPSLKLDSNQKPVVSYLDATNGKLKVLHCGNTLCTSGNSLTSLPANAVAGYYSSLSLDANNIPTISYYDLTNQSLNVVRCGDANCTNNNIINVPDSTGNVGLYTSLRLDASSNPIVSYYDGSNGNLNVLRCGSPQCGPNSVYVGDTATDVGRYGAIQLDANGKPVVSYWDNTNGDLKLLHCGDTSCSQGNSITSAYTTGNTGWDTSLALDANGYPVISFYDFTAQVMKIIHCTNANCSGVNSAVTPDSLSKRASSMALDSAGNPVIASAGQPDQGLRVVHCGDANCSANTSIASPDFPVFPANADVRGVSLVLDGSGYPVVSFFRADKNQLKLLHCGDANCSGPNNTLSILDPGAQAGDHRATSVTLDASGNPVIAYWDTANDALKVLHCGNPACNAGNSIASPATGANVGLQPSIRIDSATGRPIVSFGTSTTMSILYCGDANCTSGNVITAVDPTTQGLDSALALDADNNPVASYYTPTGKHIKVLRCATKSCQ
ncbi:hypothetical protein [Legionella taurinensis]|uniref:Uncharacterized protein n=1 Tax=Legionella taurinensis TaxID=70611 RepID=A0A3A5LF06_9GAMM|nr:hypothetical protein [Legionella taurinensis]RJT44174.1 hypothetical protein D6J04_13055 [Legionella taurinensis]RJT64896.1 hypothetical protein D6J03_13745 [Legionella taurinensis]STY26544.1 Uncharacterised protein [Legionella taurinensis]